ncbi:MAG: hypothetical protein V4596_11095 [Bdellovibrionota bacterium]
MSYMANDKSKKDDNENESSPLEEDDLKKSGLSIADIAKKVVAVGVGAAFLTEESIRSALGEVKLPKEILNLVLQNASKTKDIVADQVTKEIVKLISKIDFVKEASRFVEEHKFKIEIDITKKDKTPKP